MITLDVDVAAAFPCVLPVNENGRMNLLRL
jgi:hypothetical protein